MSNHQYFKDASANAAHSTELLLDEAFVITGIIKDKESVISAMLKAEVHRTYQDLGCLGYHKNSSLYIILKKITTNTLLQGTELTFLEITHTQPNDCWVVLIFKINCRLQSLSTRKQVLSTKYNNIVIILIETLSVGQTQAHHLTSTKLTNKNL